MQRGLAGLRDAPRPGAQRIYGEDFRQRVLALLEQPPPSGQARWDGPAVAAALQGGACGVAGSAPAGDLLAAATLLVRQHRPGVRGQGRRHGGIVSRPAGKALVICVDEKPSIQALERKTAYVETDSGKMVCAYQSTYKRHGTLNLFAALQVATGQVQRAFTQLKRREQFLQFMDQVVAETAAAQELHVILDNYGTHQKCDGWLAEHPNVHFHFTPTSASWLNQVEIWFGILSRKALRGLSTKSTVELRQAIEAFIAAYAQNAQAVQVAKAGGEGLAAS